jgi:DNA-binding response OmpR family regulator
MRVLLAGPDHAFLEVTQSFLWDFGHEAEIASDGIDCISILREFLPDVLVLDRDLLWGGSDGVLALMADDSLLSETAVVLMGEESDMDDELVALSRSPVACLAKPYRLGELLAGVNSAERLTPS